MHTNRWLGRALPVSIALVLAAAPAAGQDTSADRARLREQRQAQRLEMRQARHDAAVDRLAEKLELSDAQKSAVADVMKVDEETGRPADGWMLAAVLDETLTGEQRERLFEASKEAAIYRRGMADGMRRGGDRAGRGFAANRPAPPERLREARITTMAKALDLSDRQIRVLRIHDALSGIVGARLQARAARMGDGRMPRANRRFGR